MISKIKELSSSVIIYDEKNHQIGCIALSGGKLQGYTSTTVSILRSHTIYIYNERGKQISAKNCTSK